MASHKGLEQYPLDDGHDVVNIPELGDIHCNIGLFKITKTKYDYVFLFLVEPFAEIKEDSFWNKNPTYEDYYKRHKDQIQLFVKSLDTLSIGPIKLIGGSAKCPS